MSLITPAYKASQTAYHQGVPAYGTSSRKFVEQVRHLSDKLETRDILDYGCGKCFLQKGLPFPIQNYDPCIPEWDHRPYAADIVVCTDVLEHIEPECLEDVLADLASLTKKIALFNVACRPAKKFLQDGRNAHLIVENPNWWVDRLMKHFAIHSLQVVSGEFTAFFMPPTAFTPEPMVVE